MSEKTETSEKDTKEEKDQVGDSNSLTECNKKIPRMLLVLMIKMLIKKTLKVTLPVLHLISVMNIVIATKQQ